MVSNLTRFTPLSSPAPDIRKNRRCETILSALLCPAISWGPGSRSAGTTGEVSSLMPRLAKGRRAALRIALKLPIASSSSAFDERFQPAQCLVPLPGYVIQVALDAGDRFRLERVLALAPDPHAFHDAGVLQHAKMLADRLSREMRTLRQSSNRLRRPLTKLCNQRQPCFVAQRGKDRSMNPSCPGEAASVSSRRDARCSQVVRSSRRRSSEMLQRVDSRESRRSRIR